MADAQEKVNAMLVERPKLTGARRLVRAVLNSWKGFRGAFEAEAAFRQEVALAVVLIPLGFWLGNTPIEKVLLVGSVLFVLIVELLKLVRLDLAAAVNEASR